MRLKIHRDILLDLAQIKDENPQAAARIATFLEELKGNPDALETLLEHNFGVNQDESYHVSRWVSAWGADEPLWRLKLWDLAADGVHYRIIYAFLPAPSSTFLVLGVPPRSFNYDLSHPISQRILATFRRLSGRE